MKVRTMPPHCDAMDGPVVAASGAPKPEHRVVLPFVRDGEEGSKAFAAVQKQEGDEAAEIADPLFETVVRVHRAGEERRSRG
jgi:hypothetical protein